MITFSFLGMRGRVHVTLNQLVADTALHPRDIALAFMLLGKILIILIILRSTTFLILLIVNKLFCSFLGFIRKSVDNKFILAVDWNRVDQHAAAVAANTTRIQLDPDALMWSPTPPPGILFDSPMKSEGSEADSDVDSDREEHKNEISALGNSKGLVGGASVTSKHRRKKLSRANKSSCHREVKRESDGGSADGEQSDDSDVDSPTIGDAKYLKSSAKVSQNRSRSSFLKSPKMSDQRKARRKSRKIESSEDSDKSMDDSEPFHRGGRKAAKNASSAISKTISKQQKRSDCDETSKSDSESENERNILKHQRKKESTKHTSIRDRDLKDKSKFKRNILLESDESQDENKPPEKSVQSSKKKEERLRAEVKKISVSNPVISEDNSDHMPELEPQVQVTIPKSKEKPIYPSEKKDKKSEKIKQKSLKDYMKKDRTEHRKSESLKKESKTGEKSVIDKGQRHAIEKNFGINQGYLTAFESFIQLDNTTEESMPEKIISPVKQNDKLDKLMQIMDKKSPEQKSKNLLCGRGTGKTESNNVLLTPSSLHPKNALKAEKRKEIERERLEKQKHKKGLFDSHLDTKTGNRKDRERELNKEKERIEEKEKTNDRLEKEKLRIETERIEAEKLKELEDIKRKERLERKKLEREERKRQEKEMKEKLEKEKEKLKENELMMMEKRKKIQENRLAEQSRQEKLSIALPSTTPEHSKLSDGSPPSKPVETPCSDDSKPRLSDAETDVKTPKKLKRWLPENESPDPKKNFIKKHQEQLEEQARLSSQEVSSNREGSKDSAKKRNIGPNIEEKHDSMWENLGYNSGDDVVKFSDEQLNKNPPLKPELKAEEEETVDRPEPKPQTAEVAPIETTVEVEVAKAPEELNVPEPLVEPTSCMEQEKLQQQQLQQQSSSQQEPQQCNQQQAQQQLPQVPIEQCAVLQEQQRKLEQQQLQPPVQMEHQHIEHQTMEQQQLEHHIDATQQHMEHNHLEQQQQQQQQHEATQQQYMGDMSGGYYPTGDTGEAGNQFYGTNDKTEQGQTMGVYTPDSSTNSVHSMHGFPGHAGDGGEFHGGTGDTSTEYHPATDTNPEYQHSAADTSAEYSHAEPSESVHNSTVMESPNSIGSVEIPQVYDSMSGHHRLPANSPQQQLSAMHSSMTKLSPHHQQGITAQSPHPLPIQSPHPQPSPHNQQSSPHPQIIPQNTYTSIPHQSPTPQPTYPTSRSSQSSKSPRQHNRQAAAHLSAQQQAAHQAFTAQYIQQYGAAMKQHSANQMYRHDPAAFTMFSGTMFPATTGVGHTPPSLPSHHASRSAHHMDPHVQQVASAQVYILF